ncbi:Uncharacterised protein [Neisseria dentiae]|nr:Uncharacterised protein [Neisseria dentiae]
MNPKEAADYAYTFMFDYADVPPTIRKVRDLGILPFISYTYKAVPAMARLALTRPHRMLAVTLLMYGINAMSYLLMGEDADEEEERENMPEYQKGYTIFGTPKLIRLPWNDLDGKPMFIDVYRWLPLGDFADTQNQMGGIPLPAMVDAERTRYKPYACFACKQRHLYRQGSCQGLPINGRESENIRQMACFPMAACKRWRSILVSTPTTF